MDTIERRTKAQRNQDMTTTTWEPTAHELCDVCRRQTTVQENRWCVECRTVPAETDTIERRIATQRVEDLARLADQGERNGVRILVDHRTGQHVATSASDPTRCYVVSVERGCSCKGWAVWNRCQHHSLLLAELGRVPDGDPEPEPEPIAAVVKTGTVTELPAALVVESVTVTHLPTARCPACNGRGFVWAHEPGVQPFTRTCSPCHGVGQVEVGVLVGERELRVVA